MSRVLIVDDDDQRTQSVQRRLRDRGHECRTVPTVEAATSVLAAEPSELVVVAFRLIGDSLHSLRDLAGPDAERRVVVLCADPETGVASTLLEAGAYDVVVTADGAAGDRLAGRVMAILGATADEADSPPMRQHLAESSAILRAQLATASEGVLVVNRDGDTVSANARFWAMARVPAEMVPPASMRELLTDWFGATTVDDRAHPALLLDAPDREVSDCSNVLADGRVIAWSSQPVRLDDRTVIGRAFAFRDVTAQRAAELQLEFQASLLEEVPTAVVATTPEGVIRYWSPAAASLYGRSPDEVIGRDVRPLIFGPTPTEKSVTALRRLLRDGRWEGEVDLHRADGTVFPAILVLTRWEGTRGREPMVIGVTIDLSDRRALEMRLLQSQKMEAVGTLAGGLAHDFNNLLTGVLGSAALIREDSGLDPTTLELMDMIERAALRGRDLCRQLLGFSRSDPPAKEMVSVEGAVEEVVKIIERTFPRRVKIRVHVGADIPPILADRSNINQALMNLMVNARDAIEGGGLMTMRVSLSTGVPGDQLHHPVEDGRTYVRFDVADSGPGIPAEVMERIFEPFFTTKPTGKGTGLGLPIVYSIARSHDGQVRVWSTFDRGTTMSLFFPAVEGAIEPAPPAVHVDPAELGGDETVLVVDDEAIARGVAARILRQYGYRAIEAASGPEAIEAVRREGDAIDAILLDIVMPEMEGPEVFRRLKKMGSRIPVLLCSGFSVAGLVDRMLRLGVAGFVQKPYQLSELLPPLRKMLDRGVGATAPAPEGP